MLISDAAVNEGLEAVFPESGWTSEGPDAGMIAKGLGKNASEREPSKSNSPVLDVVGATVCRSDKYYNSS